KLEVSALLTQRRRGHPDLGREFVGEQKVRRHVDGCGFAALEMLPGTHRLLLVDERHAATASDSRQQRLYFAPDPHGQRSLRPTSISSGATARIHGPPAAVNGRWSSVIGCTLRAWLSIAVATPWPRWAGATQTFSRRSNRGS